MKKLLSIFTSNRTSLVLLLVFAVACGYGTFLENDFGTPAVRAVVYDTWWFEGIMALLGINFLLNIRRYNLLKKEKLTILLFHLGFVVIIIGAFITRYYSFEGVMNIREGSSENSVLSNKTYFTSTVDEVSERTYINPTSLTLPQFSHSYSDIQIVPLEFIPYAENTILPGNNSLLTVVIAEANQRATFVLKSGEAIQTPYGDIGFNSNDTNTISITGKDKNLFIETAAPTEYMVMATQAKGSFRSDSLVPLKTATLYRSGAISMVIKSIDLNSQVGFKSVGDKKKRKGLTSKLKIGVSNATITKEVYMDYIPTKYSDASISLDGKVIQLQIGPEKIDLGFELFLEDFELIRYPGSRSPSSYSSFLQVIDGSDKFPYTIYMNNVLDHGGFRFFQASFDDDEKGTVLSVNHDWWGTHVTYLGYFMLMLGLIWNLFDKKSRFRMINQKLSKSKAAIILIVGIFGSTSIFAQNKLPAEFVEMSGIYSAELGESFGALLIQDMDGRIKPLNTLAAELTRKLTGKTRFNFQYDTLQLRLNSNQLFLAIHAKPKFWSMAPVIKVDEEKGRLILDQMHIMESRFLSLTDFFDENGSYVIQQMVDDAYAKKPDQRNVFEEEVIKVDERFNILYKALTDSYLKLFPRPNDVNHTWYTNRSVLIGVASEDTTFIRNIVTMTFNLADKNSQDNISTIEEYVGYISKYQYRYAEDILPSRNRIKAELWYNKLQVFFHLFYSYWVIGLSSLIIAIWQVFNDGQPLKNILKWLVGFTALLFALQTANMILRWYAGGYPPWSNGYEMTILVSWAAILFGLLFNRKSKFILPLASLFTGTLLFVAFLDWLNPEITNLVPVLKSYWLKIHVAIIVSSYAPLALSALLGFLALWIKVFDPNNSRVKKTITELTYINELSMTVGISMLAIGTFLGGIWANESWGRYWGWDPKETWALISILCYAIVLHLRLVPAVKPWKYWFNAVSVVSFFSIIMTSFGVNYYLAGLHSYAQGDPLPIPNWVYVLTFIVGITLVVSYRRFLSKES